MRLCTFTSRGETRLGALRGEDEVIDLNRAYRARLDARGELRAGAVAEARIPPDMLAFLAGGDEGMVEARHAIAHAEEVVAADPVAAFDRGLLVDRRQSGFRLQAPVPRPGNVLAVGVNYKDSGAKALRWLTETYEPTLALVPAELRRRLDPPEIYHQILEHRWFLSEREGQDVGIGVAVDSYVAEVLSSAPAEGRVLAGDSTAEMIRLPWETRDPTDGPQASPGR